MGTVAEDIPPEISKLSEDEVERLSPIILGLVEHRTGRIEYAEGRRGSFAVFGGVLLAAGVAGLVQLARGGYPYLPVFLGLIFFAAALATIGATVLFIYARQTNWHYPFKDSSAVWKWFYRDAIPMHSEIHEPWHLQPSPERQQKGEAAFRDSHGPFIRQTLTLADPKINLAQDLEQLHLLHWNDFYKNAFLTSLRKVLIRGIFAALCFGLLGFLIGLVAHCCCNT